MQLITFLQVQKQDNPQYISSYTMTQLASFVNLVKLIKQLIQNEDAEPDSDIITQKFKNVVEMLVDADKTNKEELFDAFCEMDVMGLLKKLIKYNKEVVIRTLSLMLINLRNELWINYIMADKLIVELIQSPIDEENEELIQHYISFLKSISIRLDTNNLSLFYNKKFSLFPLVYKGLFFYNHPDNMVRTSVMNLTLGIMKIKDPRLAKYFSTFPFTLYLAHFCHALNHQWKQLNNIIKDPKLTKHRLKMEISDQNDSIYYLYDLYQHGNLAVKSNIKNCIFSICILPTLINQIMKEQISPKLCLYMIHSILKIFKDKDVCEFIACLLFGKRIHPQILKKINQNPYRPLSFNEIYNGKQKGFMDMFQYEITDHCQQLFKEIQNFQTQHQYKKITGEVSANSEQFYSEIKRVSDSVGFQMFSIDNAEKQFTLLQKCKLSQNSEDNPIRQKILKMLEEGDDSMVWVISNIIITIQKKEQISNQTLKYCGLLMPKLDTVNYLDDFNINSITVLKDIFLKHLKKQSTYRIVTVKNIIHLLLELFFKELNKQELIGMFGCYEEAIGLLKADLKIENLEHLGKSFFDQFKRWGNYSYVIQSLIPFSLFSNSKQSFPEIKNQEHLPCNQKEEVTRNIQLFALNRTLINTYRIQYTKINKDDLPTFQQGYTIKFNLTSTKWKVGKSYQIENRTMVECKQLYTDKRKPINLLLIEDPYNFVLVEPSSENELATIYLNLRYKYINFELMKNEPKNILLTWVSETSGQKILGFSNEIQAMQVHQRIKKKVRSAFEEKQAYILKFVHACQKDLKGAIGHLN